MKRFLHVLAITGAIVGAAACNKPSAEECRQAIGNMEKLLGTDVAARNLDNEGEVRRCRGGSRKEAVACAAKATTLDELKACAFMTPRSGSSRGKPAASPTEKPADKPAAEPSDKPADKSSDKPAAEPSDKPADKPAAEPSAK